jgi:hypothetical protein
MTLGLFVKARYRGLGDHNNFNEKERNEILFNRKLRE